MLHREVKKKKKYNEESTKNTKRQNLESKIIRSDLIRKPKPNLNPP